MSSVRLTTWKNRKMTPPLQIRGSRKVGDSTISTSTFITPRLGSATPLTTSSRIPSTPRPLSGRAHQLKSLSPDSTLSLHFQRSRRYSLASATSQRAAIRCTPKTEATWDLRRFGTATPDRTACGLPASLRPTPRGERCGRGTITASRPTASASSLIRRAGKAGACLKRC